VLGIPAAQTIEYKGFGGRKARKMGRRGILKLRGERTWQQTIAVTHYDQRTNNTGWLGRKLVQTIGRPDSSGYGKPSAPAMSRPHFPPAVRQRWPADHYTVGNSGGSFN
jgi:hypothetical protein